MGVEPDDDVTLAHSEVIVSGREFAHVHPDGSLHARNGRRTGRGVSAREKLLHLRNRAAITGLISLHNCRQVHGTTCFGKPIWVDFVSKADLRRFAAVGLDGARYRYPTESVRHIEGRF